MQRGRSGWRTPLTVLGLMAGLGASRAEALLPEQIAVIVNSRSKPSRDIALAYQTARGIPRENIIFIDLDLGENIEEPAYNLKVKAPIRRYLLEHKLERKITCLVTTFDAPLKVGPQSMSPADAGEVLSLRKQMVGGMEELQQSVKAFDAILPGVATTAPAATDDQPKPAVLPLDQLTKALEAAAKGAQERIKKSAGAAQKRGAVEYVELYERLLGGLGSVSSREMALLEMDQTALTAHLAPIELEMQKGDAEIAELTQRETEPGARTHRMEITRQMHGLLGVIHQAQRDLQMLQRDQTEGSIDSELMCLWNDHYFKAQWIWNPLLLERFTPPVAGTAATLPAVGPADPGPWRPMMVCRLDGSSTAKVLEMITNSLKIEKTGLEGTFYIDADGKGDTSPYGLFDDDLRKTFKFVKANSTFPVVMEDTAELMQAKDCPNAALYVGWYAPGNYHESCQWLPGAVGYHVASGELQSLHNPEEKGWVKNLLDRGFAGSLGPTHEPYLHSFPKPSEFFPLLLSGQWTQGEVFYMTNPLLSWRIAFVGDPLYNPFKNKPQITVEVLKADPILRKAFEIFPLSAATQPGQPGT